MSSYTENKSFKLIFLTQWWKDKYQKGSGSLNLLQFSRKHIVDLIV